MTSTWRPRRGSTDLDWISKYQHSDHHVDRQTRNLLENKSSECLAGLPPTPNNRFGSYKSTTKQTSPNNFNLNYDTPIARTSSFNFLPTSGTRGFSTYGRSTTDENSSSTFRLRPGSLSPAHLNTFRPVSVNPHAPFDYRRRHSVVDLSSRSILTSASTPSSRRGSVSVFNSPSVLNRKSIVGYNYGIPDRTWRAMSMPPTSLTTSGELKSRNYDNYDYNASKYGFNGITGRRLSYVLPQTSYNTPTFKRHSYVPSREGSTRNSVVIDSAPSKQFNLYNNNNDARYKTEYNFNNGYHGNYSGDYVTSNRLPLRLLNGNRF